MDQGEEIMRSRAQMEHKTLCRMRDMVHCGVLVIILVLIMWEWPCSFL